MRDPGAWLAHHARIDRGRARRRWQLARGLDDHGQVARGMRDGTVTTDQARVIAAAVDALAGEVDTEVRERAEQHLVDQAANFAPEPLRVPGRRVLDVIAPELAEEGERLALEAEELRAARRTFLRFRRNGDGTTDINARVADRIADRLRTYLNASTNPRRPDASATDPAADPTATHHSSQTEPGESGEPSEPNQPPQPTRPIEPSVGSMFGPTDQRPYSHRLGAAFGSLLEHLDPQRLPLHGGDATTVIVTIDHQVLTDALAGVGLVGDEPITAADARRLACSADILPAVFGGASQMLDLGRTRRLASAAQRKARAVLDRTCRADGCDIPAPWCEAHHLRAWLLGGRTDLADLVLFCSHHHHLAHDTRHETIGGPGGRYRFRRLSPGS